ncbi:MAG TPA: hypothetical protein VGG75_40480 [Trebonia sp.]
MRRNPSTVVILAGKAPEGLLSAVGRSMNVSLVRPDDDGPEAAAAALRRAARISSPYVLVAADPLAAVAAEWEAMWQVTAQARGSDTFELRAGEALAAWRSSQFELPDYYLVLASGLGEHQAGGRDTDVRDGRARQAGAREAGSGEPATADPSEAWQRPDFYLGPLRAVRPHRVAAVAATEPAEQTAAVLTALGSLRHGRWWPSLEEIIASARTFYPGSLTESESELAASRGRLLS